MGELGAGNTRLGGRRTYSLPGTVLDTQKETCDGSYLFASVSGFGFRNRPRHETPNSGPEGPGTWGQYGLSQTIHG